MCEVCSLGALETPWAHYRNDRGTLTPELTTCRDCYDVVVHGIQPENPSNHREVAEQLRSDPAARIRTLVLSSKMQKGGARIASEGCANFVPESLVTEDRVEMIWEDRYDIQLAADFCGDAIAFAALPSTEMKDPRGETHMVILTDGGQRPVAVVRRTVAIATTKHHLRPDTMVCLEQASRVQSTVELPFKLPTMAMTTEMYEQKHGRIAAPAQDGCSDIAAHGASVERPTGLACLPPSYRVAGNQATSYIVPGTVMVQGERVTFGSLDVGREL